MKEKLLTTKNVVLMGMFGALAGVLMLFEFPLPFLAPSFYGLDVSEVPVLIGTFAMGPVAGVIMEVVKILVKLLTLGDKLSNMRSTARDYMVIGDEIWQRFNEKHRECHQWYLEGIMDGLQELRELPPFQELERLYHLVYES